MRAAVVIDVPYRARPPASGRITRITILFRASAARRATSILREWTEPRGTTSKRFRTLGHSVRS